MFHISVNQIGQEQTTGTIQVKVRTIPKYEHNRTLCGICKKSASKIRKSENENFKLIVQNAQKNTLR